MESKIFKDKPLYPTYEEIITEFSLTQKKVQKKKGNSFGYWLQTVADIQFLDLELSGLISNYKINSVSYQVEFKGGQNTNLVKDRIAHLDTVNDEMTTYAEITDLFGDTNAYAFHNLYPYKGKFYPRLVRTIANAFQLNNKHVVLDPYNGCGTTTHECSLLGIKSIGVDINPIGNLIALLKNDLIFLEEKVLAINESQLEKYFKLLKEKKRACRNNTLYKLLLLIYFDTIDAFARTTRYSRKGELLLFIDKFKYIRSCHHKLNTFLNKRNRTYVPAEIREGTVLDLKQANIENNSVDAVITSPPYYFSLDYVGKDKIAYDYLNDINFFQYAMNDVKNKYLGMKIISNLSATKMTEKKVITYFIDLEQSIKEMIRVTKKGGKLAIVIGDSSLNGSKLPTTAKTHQFCLAYGLTHIRTVFNPLLGARNRAIRGESVLLYEKN